MTKTRKFQRPLGERRYRKLFIIAVEGSRTEPQYFALFNYRDSIIKIECLKDKHASAPPQVLGRLKKYLKDEPLKTSDEAWLVVDKDQWTETQLKELWDWSRKKENYGFALSNPKFEYWLILHFEAGDGIATSRDCDDRLKKYLPDYVKSIDPGQITRQMIDEAIERARKRDNPPCSDWPRSTGTTVYKLVENILKAGG